jgi:hypothetical protein
MILKFYCGGQNYLFSYDNEEFGICIFLQKIEVIKKFVICYVIHLLAIQMLENNLRFKRRVYFETL